MSMASPRFVFALIVAALGLMHLAPAASTREPIDTGFQAFLREFEQGTTRFINGDAAAWKANASHRDDVTLMGGWGIVARGWADVGARYDWAAARFRDSGAVVNVEYVSTVVSGDLACTVAVERSTVRLIDQPNPAPMALRVTHAFRKEDGRWKLIHRHADPILETTAPGAVLTK
jgi:ketosteroid isomerase-like protein